MYKDKAKWALYLRERRKKQKESISTNPVTGEIKENKVREYQQEHKTLKILTNPKTKHPKVNKSISQRNCDDGEFGNWLKANNITERHTIPFDLEFYQFLASV